MKKIPSVFQRNYETDRLVRDEVVPGSEWVLAGEGRATRKWDGTACLVRDGRLFKRYDAKHGKTPPAGWEPCQEADPVSGHHPGWVPIGSGPEDALHREAEMPAESGTYELVGPRINRNPDGFSRTRLVPHGAAGSDERTGLSLEAERPGQRTFASIRAQLETLGWEGIVYHHPDGRMAKIKRKDFGFDWPVKR